MMSKRFQSLRPMVLTLFISFTLIQACDSSTDSPVYQARVTVNLDGIVWFATPCVDVDSNRFILSAAGWYAHRSLFITITDPQPGRTYQLDTTGPDRGQYVDSTGSYKAVSGSVTLSEFKADRYVGTFAMQLTGGKRITAGSFDTKNLRCM